MKKKRKLFHGMPPLTIDGKRQIIKEAMLALGERQLTVWLKKYNIPSIVYFKEHVRQYKAKLFRDLYDQCHLNRSQ